MIRTMRALLRIFTVAVVTIIVLRSVVGAQTPAPAPPAVPSPAWAYGVPPRPPDVILKGRAPGVRGCGMCHMPNGKGRPENAPVAGLPYTYIVQQLLDFKNDLRGPADPRKTNTGQMIEGAKAMTDDE